LRVFSIARNQATSLLELTPGPFSFEFPFGGSPAWGSFAPNNANFAPQSGTTNRIHLGDSRIQNCAFRNGTLWVAQTIFLPAGGPATRSSVQWWELTPGGTVLQRGRIDDPGGGRFFAYPSIAVNRRLDVLVGYSRFGAGQFPSANYSFRIDADIFSTLRDDTVLKAGEAPFFVDDAGVNHWGDWSATMVDPNNDTDFWTVQQYAASPVSGSDRWGTWWGRIARVPAAPVITSVRTMAGGTEISFTTEVGSNYTVEFKDDLPAPGWSMLPTMPGPGGVMTVTDPNVVTQRFYRVRVE
jgi:hypothetical protein